MPDLLVIGAGLTGLMAAHTAAKSGHSVKVVAKGLGALQLSAGTVDVLGYAPGSRAPVMRPLDAIDELGLTEPAHPYVLVGVPRVRAALEQFATLTLEMGLPYRGAATPGDNLWLPSPVGARRPAFFAPQAQCAGDLSRPEPMLILGLQGLRDFYPELIAENLSKQGHRARAAFLPLALITDRRDINTAQLARALDDPARRERLAAAIKPLVQPGERIGLPAVLGMDTHTAALEQLQALTGATVFEIPTLPPSVPGMRLDAALRRALQRMGVRVDINMEVKAFHAQDGHIVSVESDASGRPLKHTARNFLLATGGFLGGGITSDHTGKVWETIFDLPLAAPPARAQWFSPHFFDPAGHPVFRGGVPVNCDFQPVDARGARVYANLWAAGVMLAHADSILERSLEGISVLTGVAAAQKIM